MCELDGKQMRAAEREVAQRLEEHEMARLNALIADPCKPLALKLHALGRCGELVAHAGERLLEALEDAQ